MLVTVPLLYTQKLELGETKKNLYNLHQQETPITR